MKLFEQVHSNHNLDQVDTLVNMCYGKKSITYVICALVREVATLKRVIKQLKKENENAPETW